MVTTELLAYISREIKRGTNKDDISKSLKSNGWGDNDLKEAFALSPVPKGAPPVTPINPPANSASPLKEEVKVKPLPAEPIGPPLIRTMDTDAKVSELYLSKAKAANQEEEVRRVSLGKIEPQVSRVAGHRKSFGLLIFVGVAGLLIGLAGGFLLSKNFYEVSVPNFPPSSRTISDNHPPAPPTLPPAPPVSTTSPSDQIMATTTATTSALSR
ncbi:MAG TPA: hypothetical protein VJJ73_01650 [Candidatus Paceibacterota bacterium]